MWQRRVAAHLRVICTDGDCSWTSVYDRSHVLDGWQKVLQGGIRIHAADVRLL